MTSTGQTAPEGPAIAETHISVVAMIGDRAYKLMKPVDVGFLDHRSREARRRACEREVAVNRRFAPDVYLGVLDVVDERGEPRDHLVEMRRLPAARRLSALLGARNAAETVRKVAVAVAALHADAPASVAIARAGAPERVCVLWDANQRALCRSSPGVLAEEELHRADALAAAYLAGRAPLLERRVDEGWIRDGHGDLLAEDVYCLPDGPRFLDCLAFDDDLRHGDVLADVAFLAMDIEAKGRADLARALLEAWGEALGGHHSASLGHYYIAYRAAVRAKVAALRAAAGASGADGTARALVRLAVRHLERGRVRLLLVGGLPGTGKSTLSSALVGRTGWSLLRTDELRPAAGNGHAGSASGYREGPYAPEATDLVYRELLGQAERLLVLGESVVLDASWGSASHRAAARRAAAAAGATVVEVRCEAPADVAAERIESRRRGGRDPSEATRGVALRMTADAAPWPEAARLPTDRPLDSALRALLQLVGPSGP